jgi:hypothetical protein
MLCLCDIIAPIKCLSAISSSHLWSNPFLLCSDWLFFGFHGFWDLFVVHRGTLGRSVRGQHPVVCYSWLQFTNCDFITPLKDEMRFCLACLRQSSSSLNDVDASWESERNTWQQGSPCMLYNYWVSGSNLRTPMQLYNIDPLFPTGD